MPDQSNRAEVAVPPNDGVVFDNAEEAIKYLASEYVSGLEAERNELRQALRTIGVTLSLGSEDARHEAIRIARRFGGRR